MKKTLSLILAAVMIAAALLTFASCGKAGSGKVKVIDIALSEEEYAFAVNKSDTELLAKANEYLTKIKGDGTFDAICNKYFGDGVPTKVTSGTLDESKDQLVVATSTGFEPFEMVDESGKLRLVDKLNRFFLQSLFGRRQIFHRNGDIGGNERIAVLNVNV